MTKWEYAHAIYDGQGLDPHIEMDVDSTGDLGHFLRVAGEKGWELCATLPYPTIKPPQPPEKTLLAVIFKRPIRVKSRSH